MGAFKRGDEVILVRDVSVARIFDHFPDPNPSSADSEEVPKCQREPDGRRLKSIEKFER